MSISPPSAADSGRIMVSLVGTAVLLFANGLPRAHAEELVSDPSSLNDVAQTIPAVESLLDQLEAAAADHRTLTARVRMRSIQDLLDDETTRFGDLAWARAAPSQTTAARFAVAFDRLQPLDGPLEVIDRRYIYDGHWLLDVDAQAGTATRRELTRARDHTTRAEPSGLAFGDGPFLVPLNLKKNRVLAKFEVRLAPPDPETDPQDAETDHLILIPRPTTRSQAIRLDLWFDRTTRLPHRAASTQADGDQTVIDLFEIAVNPPLPNQRFATVLPEGQGWQLQSVPLNAATGQP